MRWRFAPVRSPITIATDSGSGPNLAVSPPAIAGPSARSTADGWVCEWQPFADGGVVRWPEILSGLRARGYIGALSLHVHYPAADPVAAVRRDLDHLRGLLG